MVVASLIALVLIAVAIGDHSKTSLTSANSSSRASSSKISSSDTNEFKGIPGDNRFVEDIKNHEIHPLTDYNQYSFRNNTDNEGTDGDYSVAIPTKWSIDNSADGNISLQTDETQEPLAVLHIETFASFDWFDEGPIDADQMCDIYFDASPIKGVPSERIALFKKTINGNEYWVGIKLMPTEGDDNESLYNVFYTRVLENGVHSRSLLLASVVFRESEIKSNRELVLNDIYSLEDVLGTFDESKQ